MHDAVNHPSHYSKNGGIECIEAIEASMDKDAFRGLLKGNVIKYIWRYEDKNGLEDLKKCRWYLDALIFSLETEGEQQALEALENASMECKDGVCPIPGIRYDLPGRQVTFEPIQDTKPQ